MNNMEESGKRYKGWLVAGAIALLILFCTFFFRVKKISVEGNTYYSQEKMAEMFQKNFLEKNIITFWLMDKLSLTPELEFVREYEVSYPSVNEIHIKLYEKKIVAGIAYSNQYIYFDKDGMVLQSADRPVENIPLFEIKNLTTFTLYRKVQMEDQGLLNQILNLANLFQHYHVGWDKVQFDSNNEAYLYSGEIKVSLGKKDNYDEEISALSSVLKKMAENGQVGEIDMRNYKVGGDVILKRPRIREGKN